MAVKRKSKARAIKATKKTTRVKSVVKKQPTLRGTSFKGGYSKERILALLASAKAKRAISIAKTLVFIAVVVLAAVSLLSTLPIKTPIKPFIVTSGSMRPSIYEGSVSFVNREYGEVNVGDIITFIRPDDFSQNVTHRVVGKEFVDGKAVYKTKGDANNAEDAWVVRPEAVWGKVAFSIPVLGYAVNFSKTKVGVVLLVVIPLILISVDELRIIRREVLKIRKGRKSEAKIGKKAVAALLIYLIPLISSNVANTKASWTDNTNISGNSANTGFWIPPTVNVTSPASGDVWYHLNTYDIKWTAIPGCSTCTINDITISYSVDGGAFVQIATSEANDDIFSWTVPDGIFSSNVVIQITATDTHNLVGSDVSDAFTIKSPIVINEFYVNPQGDQWIEVKNLGGVNIDMVGWNYVRGNQTLFVSTANSDNDTNPGGATVVSPGGYLLTTFSSDFQLPPGGPHTFSLLYNPGGILVDSATFTTPIPPISQQSFARCPDGTGAFEVTTTLTPLAANQCTSTPLILGAESNTISISESPVPSPSSEPTPTPLELFEVLTSPDPLVEEPTGSQSATPVPSPSVDPTLTPSPGAEPTPVPPVLPEAVDIIPIEEVVNTNV